VFKRYLIKEKNFTGNYSYYFCVENVEKIISFYTVPKNANSSLKLFILQHLGFDYKSSDFPKIPESEINNTEMKKKYWEIVNSLPNYQLFTKTTSFNLEGKKIEKIAIYRDPFKRFESCYKNRVLFHQDKNVKGMSVDDILKNLNIKKVDNRHFLPQNLFLGDDPSYYDVLVSTDEIEKLEKYLNNFFEKKIKFPKVQDGGNEFLISLTKKQKELIKDIYKFDFEFINKINK
jgi:hypothetical protein